MYSASVQTRQLQRNKLKEQMKAGGGKHDQTQTFAIDDPWKIVGSQLSSGCRISYEIILSSSTCCLEGDDDATERPQFEEQELM